MPPRGKGENLTPEEKEELLSKAEYLYIQNTSLNAMAQQLKVDWITAKSLVESVKLRWKHKKKRDELDQERNKLIAMTELAHKRACQSYVSFKGENGKVGALNAAIKAVQQLSRLNGLDVIPIKFEDPDGAGLAFLDVPAPLVEAVEATLSKFNRKPVVSEAEE